MTQLIVIKDHGVEPLRAKTRQARLSGLQQRLADATAAPVRMYRQTVEMSAPPVPPGDHRSDQVIAILHHQQRLRIPLEQSQNRTSAVDRSARVLCSDQPEVEEGIDI